MLVHRRCRYRFRNAGSRWRDNRIQIRILAPDDASSTVIMGGAFSREGVGHELIVMGGGHGLGGEANAETVIGRTIGGFDRHLSNSPEKVDRQVPINCG